MFFQDFYEAAFTLIGHLSDHDRELKLEVEDIIFKGYYSLARPSISLVKNR